MPWEEKRRQKSKKGKRMEARLSKTGQKIKWNC